MTLTTPTGRVPRDGKQRPLIIPEGGGRRVAYQRTTTFTSTIEDRYKLEQWKQRAVALGLTMRPDLALRVASIGLAGLSGDDQAAKNALDDACEDAREAAKANAAATTGTALHALTETLDRGEAMPVIPEAYLADLEAYEKATAVLDHEHIEAFTVHDPLKVGGTPDRISRYQGRRYIADVKTGDITFGALSISMQLAMYARSKLYDPTTGNRVEHGAEVDRAIVIHLPAGQGTCRLYWFDILAGWEACRVALGIRDKRRIRFADIAVEVDPGTDAPAPVTGPDLVDRPLDLGGLGGTLVDVETPSLADRIATADTVAEVRDLWRRNSKEWTDDLTALAKARIQELEP